MKIQRVKIAGFRGFNEERTIDFHEELTLIAAPNSHGKTSISEALEFLFYGATSKVEHADSKEEYQNSYRNRHYPLDKVAYIEACFSVDENSEILLRVELDPAESVQRFVDGKAVPAWPFAAAMATASRPFVLQHALKYLLLVRPADRFQGFARLLGLNEVEKVQQALVNLCTKPEASIPEEARRALLELGGLELRLTSSAPFTKVARALKRGPDGVDLAYELIESRIQQYIGKKLGRSESLAALIKQRDEVSARVYSGTVAVKDLAEKEEVRASSARQALLSTVNTEMIEDYAALAAKGTTERLLR
jgi:hypothetical protein